jgi:hypothetical protein
VKQGYGRWSSVSRPSAFRDKHEKDWKKGENAKGKGRKKKDKVKMEA